MDGGLESTFVLIVKAIVIFLFVLQIVPIILWAERKVLGRFQSRIGRDDPVFLQEHCVFGTPIVPAAAWLDMALAAGRAAFGTEGAVLEDVAFQQPLLLPEEETAGSADPEAQAEAILEETDERTQDPEGTQEASEQTGPRTSEQASHTPTGA